MSRDSVDQYIPRIDLLATRWIWAAAGRVHPQGGRGRRRPWSSARRPRAAAASRNIGLAMVSPEMVAEAALTAGWPPVMTLEEAAEAMRISPQTLRRYVSEGKFKKSVKRGWPTLFWRDSLISEFMKGPRR